MLLLKKPHRLRHTSWEQTGHFPTVETHGSLFPHFGRSGFRAEAGQVSQGTGPWPQSTRPDDPCPAGQTDGKGARVSGGLPELGHVRPGPQGHWPVLAEGRAGAAGGDWEGSGIPLQLVHTHALPVSQVGRRGWEGALCWTHSRRCAPQGSSRVPVPRQRRGTQAPRGKVTCRVTAGLVELRSHRQADHWR